MSSRFIYKIADQGLWDEAVATGVFTGAPVDHADGYIHFSTLSQVAETARRHFAGRSDLVIATVATDDLGPALRFEPSRGGDLFPHLYAPLDLRHVVSVAPLPLGPDGDHLFPPLADGSAT